MMTTRSFSVACIMLPCELQWKADPIKKKNKNRLNKDGSRRLEIAATSLNKIHR